MNIIHLTASRFFGGPERQMLGLAKAMRPAHRTVVVSFAEEGLCAAFLRAARAAGVEAIGLRHDTPHLLAARAELTTLLRQLDATVLLCHGYKASLVGRPAARRMGVPVIAVSRGWTGQTLRVKLYELLDRVHLHLMDHVVCVSQAQADKVKRWGVPECRVDVIRNAIGPDRFATTNGEGRSKLLARFSRPPRWIVGAAGRLSHEKGFDVLVQAAAHVFTRSRSVGFVLFGDGPQRRSLERQIKRARLQRHFILAGFQAQLDGLLPGLDVLVSPSRSEGLPNVLLEACAAAVPVVATAVGGTPEIITHGDNGLLVRRGDADGMATAVLQLLNDAAGRRAMGQRGRARVVDQFSFSRQAAQYERLLNRLLAASGWSENGAGRIPPSDRFRDGWNPPARASASQARDGVVH